MSPRAVNSACIQSSSGHPKKSEEQRMSDRLNAERVTDKKGAQLITLSLTLCFSLCIFAKFPMALRVSSSAPTTYISQLQSSSSSSSVVVSFSFKSHPLLLSPFSFASSSSSFFLSPIRRLRSPRSRVVRAEAAVDSGNGAVVTADKPDSNTPTPSGRVYFPLAAVVGQVLTFFFSLCICAF